RVRKRKAIIVFGDQRDRSQIAELETGILVGNDVDRLEMRAKKKRIAVGRARDHIARGGNAARSGIVHEKDALAYRFAELVGDKPRRNVGRTADAKADDEPDGPLRVVAGKDRGRPQSGNQG